MNMNKKNLTPISLGFNICFNVGFIICSCAAYMIYFVGSLDFGGTTQNASGTRELPKIVIDQNYQMRFDTNVHSTSSWKFYPEKNIIDLKPGEVHTVKFNVENPTNEISSGSASFNVSPSPFGIYLNKIGCFCFEKQTLKT